ncbi:hypothetical protein B566_EDAN013881 [Ephemera danica]|nr:hypothetical protein B566_EDAN013881 [Ephemera danica]
MFVLFHILFKRVLVLYLLILCKSKCYITMESGDGSSSREPSVKNSGDMSGCGCGAGGANSGGTNSTTNPGSGTSTGSGTQNISTAQVEESILVRVTPTTGGQFDILVCKNESVENLKKRLSKKLKVPKERICLLHRDRQLREGSLHENQLVDGSRLTLLPSVETGLLAQRPEQSVMQALESLNDSQVSSHHRE